MKIENIVQRFSCISFLTDMQYQPYVKKTSLCRTEIYFGIVKKFIPDFMDYNRNDSKYCISSFKIGFIPRISTNKSV